MLSESIQKIRWIQFSILCTASKRVVALGLGKQDGALSFRIRIYRKRSETVKIHVFMKLATSASAPLGAVLIN